MGKRVECAVEEITENSRAAVRATCSQCDHVTTSFGTSDKSVKRCLVLMREQCPEGEENFYVEDGQ